MRNTNTDYFITMQVSTTCLQHVIPKTGYIEFLVLQLRSSAVFRLATEVASEAECPIQGLQCTKDGAGKCAKQLHL
jgi:hypothetical protein